MSVALESKNRINALISAANEATGKTNADLTSAVNALIDGFGQGGDGNMYSGEIVTDAITTIHAKGNTLNLGLPSRAKWFFMWFDRDDFANIESPANNHYNMVLMLPVTLSEIIPIRSTNTFAVPDTADRFFIASSYYNTTASVNGYGSTGFNNFVTANTEVWSANEDGTITISRFGSATTYLFAGTYHWIAVC